MRSIKEWQTAVHKCAKEHGWYKEDRGIPELLCLLHSEISEALEEYRIRNSSGFAEEMADIAIRLFDMCEYLDINLEAEIETKYVINLSRPYRHGNKRC
jgi:NTP pyrophosphatase (non-canonical NTP hydrolase)